MRHAMQVRGACRGMVMGILAVAILAMAGCNDFYGEDKYYKQVITEEQLKTVEALPIDELVVTGEGEAVEEVPEELYLTIDECRAIALENNLDLKILLYNPAMKREAVKALDAVYEPYFFDTIGYSKTDSASISAEPDYSAYDPCDSDATIPLRLVKSADQDKYFQNTVGINVPLKTGGSIQVSSAYFRSKRENVNSLLNPFYRSSGEVTFSQSLLRGAGVKYATYKIQQGKYDSEISLIGDKVKAVKFISDVDKFYWSFYSYQEQMKIQEEDLLRAQLQLERTRRMVKAGQLPQIEVLRAEYDYASIELAITRLKNNMKDYQRQLKQVLNKPGLPMEGKTKLILTSKPLIKEYNIDYEKVLDYAYEHRMDLLQQEIYFAQLDNQLDYFRNQLLPDLSMSYTYKVSGVGDRSGQTYEDVYDRRFGDHSFGLSLKVPLGNAVAKTNLRVATLQLQKQKLTQQQIKDLVKQEVLKVVDGIDQIWQEMESLKINLQYAKRNYEAELRNYEQGLQNFAELRMAQGNYVAEQSKLIDVKIRYQLAQMDLALATGTLLKATRFEWQEYEEE